MGPCTEIFVLGRMRTPSGTEYCFKRARCSGFFTRLPRRIARLLQANWLHLNKADEVSTHKGIHLISRSRNHVAKNRESARSCAGIALPTTERRLVAVETHGEA